MAVEQQSRWRTMLWVVSASLALHVLIVGLFYLPAAYKQPEPAPEENVSVELVPPPEEPKPEEKKPDEKKAELPKPPEPKPEEKKPPELPPEPPKAEKPPEQPKPPKEEKPPEQPKAEPPPPPLAPKPPEPPKPPEAPKPPPKALEPEKPPEPKPPEPTPPEQPKEEADKPNGQDTSAKSMIQPLKPVFRFGDKDTGPKKSDGDSADGGTKPDEASKLDGAKADPALDKPVPPDQQPPNADASDKPANAKPPVDKLPADKPSDSALTVGKPAGAGPLPPGINLPEVDAADSNAEKNGAPGEASDAANVNLSPEQAKELADVAAQPPRPEARPTPPTKAEHLTKAKTLFSQSDSGGNVATTAIGDIPRGVRIGQLCATELREQLRHSAYQPEMVRAYGLRSGTVMDVPHSEFRAAGQWYNLSFRCEVDGDGTSVTSFAFNIGEAVPRSQWRSRGFPQD